MLSTLPAIHKYVAPHQMAIDIGLEAIRIGSPLIKGRRIRNAYTKNAGGMTNVEPLGMAKQMIDFQKATFDNTFNAMVLLQDQTERMVGTFMEQATFLPEEGKKMMRDWAQAFKKGREEFKAAVDESFGKVEAYFAEAGK
jgi:hypothetical protein